MSVTLDLVECCRYLADQRRRGNNPPGVTEALERSAGKISELQHERNSARLDLEKALDLLKIANDEREDLPSAAAHRHE